MRLDINTECDPLFSLEVVHLTDADTPTETCFPLNAPNNGNVDVLNAFLKISL